MDDARVHPGHDLGVEAVVLRFEGCGDVDMQPTGFAYQRDAAEGLPWIRGGLGVGPPAEAHHQLRGSSSAIITADWK
jgi:hypothetical protein